MYQLSASIEHKIIKEAIKQIKEDFKKDIKNFDHKDWYDHLASYIDGEMIEYVGVEIGDDVYEVILEGLVNKAILKVTKKRHPDLDDNYKKLSKKQLLLLLDFIEYIVDKDNRLKAETSDIETFYDILLENFLEDL